MTARLFPMPAHHFQAWLDEMAARGLSEAECARRLGVAQVQTWRWKQNGAPGYIRLAITAVVGDAPLWWPKR